MMETEELDELALESGERVVSFDDFSSSLFASALVSFLPPAFRPKKPEPARSLYDGLYGRPALPG